MSKRQFITLRTRNSNEEVVLELPGNNPIEELMPDLLKTLNWPLTRGKTKLRYNLALESGEKLDISRSFAEAGAENFDVLWIELDEQCLEQAEKVNESTQGLISGAEVQIGESKVETEGELPPPFWSQVPIDGPCLVSSGGVIFMLGQPPQVIGRRSNTIAPHIDLTELDTDFISSRKHAEIIQVKGSYALRAQHTKNGMLVNGSELPSGEIHILGDGDVLQFGFRGVQLIYRVKG